MALTYSGIPKQLSKPLVNVVSGLLTQAITGNIYLQARNRQGWNLLSTNTPISLASGQGLEVIIPDCSGCGWDVYEYIVCFSTSTYLNAVVLCTYPGDGELPGLITLEADEHFEVNKSVSTESQLPSNPIEGMRRFVTAWDEIREWDGSNWVSVFPNSFSTVVASTTAGYGFATPISQIPDTQVIKIPKYGASGNQFSEAVTFWIRNNTTTAITAGKTIRVELTWGDVDLTELFFGAGAVYLTFNGFVSTLTGEIDTSLDSGGSMSFVDTQYQYTSNVSGLVLEKDLQPDWAYSVSVEIKTDITSLGGRIGNLAEIEIDIRFSQANGIYSSNAKILGDVIAASEQQRLIVPASGLSAIALPGSGAIKGRAWNNVSQQTIPGLKRNTPDQIIAINGNGTCTVVSTIQSFQVLRATVGTVDGVGVLIGGSTVSLNSTTVLTIRVTHPTVIRSDYPDPFLSGQAYGEFNADSIRVYLESSGTVWEYDYPITPDEAVDTLVINSLGTVVSERPSSELGLFSPTLEATTGNGSSGFTSGSYTVWVGYYYEDTVTSIDNSGDILTLRGTIIEEIEQIALEKALIFG